MGYMHMSTFSKKCLRSPLSLSLGPDYQVHIQVVNSVWTVSFTCTALHDFSFYPFHSIKERPIRRTTKKQKSFLLVCTAPCFCFHFSCIYQSNKSMLCFILFFFYRLWHLLSFIAKKKKKKEPNRHITTTTDRLPSYRKSFPALCTYMLLFNHREDPNQTLSYLLSCFHSVCTVLCIARQSTQLQLFQLLLYKSVDTTKKINPSNRIRYNQVFLEGE